MCRYFVKINIPDFERMNPPVPLDMNAISYDHGANTLIIKYKKPQIILKKEQEERIERAKLTAQQSQPPKDGDVECKQQ
jgi:hypothetical protein